MEDGNLEKVSQPEATPEDRKTVFLYAFYKENKNTYMLLSLSLFMATMAASKVLTSTNIIEQTFVLPLLLITSIPLGLTYWRSKINRNLLKETVKTLVGDREKADMEAVQAKYIRIAKTFPIFTLASVTSLLRRYFVWLTVINTIFLLPLFTEPNINLDKVVWQYGIGLIIGFAAAYLLSPLVTFLKERELKKFTT